MSHAVPIDFSFDEMRLVWGSVSGMTLWVKAWIYDWYFDNTQNGTATCRVIQDGVNITVLGRLVRTFKPQVPFTIYVSFSKLVVT